MHSYGQSDGMSSVFLYIGIAFAAIAVLGVLARKRVKSESEKLRTKN